MMYTEHGVILLLASLILLVAMIGSIAITLRPRLSLLRKTLFTPIVLPFRRLILNKPLRLCGGAGTVAGGSAQGDDQPASAQEAQQHLNDALREKGVCEAESASLAAQGKTASAAEAAQDAQEWAECAEAASAALI